MQEFLSTNWLSMISIVIGVFVAYIFYRLQKKDSASASAERKKHANSELIDVVESYIINKQEISSSVIDNLIDASERFHSVVLRPNCTAIALLQDVALRLQRSRHLDIPQKSEYSVQIDSLIREVKVEMTPLTWEAMTSQAKAIIEEVICLVPEERRPSIAEKLGILASLSKLVSSHGELFKLDSENSRLSWITAALAGVTSALAASAIGKKIFSTFEEPTFFIVAKPGTTIVWISVMLVLGAITVYFLRDKRKADSSKVEN